MTRRGARRAGQEKTEAAFRQLPWQELRYHTPPTEPLDEEAIERIHEASMEIIETIGIHFFAEEARDILKKAGAEVEEGGLNVRMDRALVMEALAHAPRSFVFHARNPARSVTIGDDHLVFATVSSPPYVSDLDRGRREGNQHDFQNLLRLAQTMNTLHVIGGHMVEPTDLHASIRHLEALYDYVTLTDKPFKAYSLGRERICDALEIARIARGQTHEEFEQQVSLITNVNSSSPLRFDTPMLIGMIECAKRIRESSLRPSLSLEPWRR